MPIKISLPFDPDKIEKTIHYWLDLLTKEDYNEAYNVTAHDPYYKWTPASIEDYINGYGLPYSLTILAAHNKKAFSIAPYPHQPVQTKPHVGL